MSRGEPRPIAVQPIINYPREAEVGQKYLMTIDLRPASVGDDWPYGDEEYAVYCMLDTEPLFSYEPLGEPAVVLHRFGGTYGSARFLLTAKRLGTKGSIRVTLVNGWGMPLYSLNLPGIQVMQEAARPLGKITAVEKPLPPSVDSHRNPFHLATIDQVERFYNRQSEVSYALDVLLQGGNVEVTGPRRIGKTWLLHYISHPTVLQEHGVDPQRSLFVYLDCQRHLGRQKEAQAYRTMSERVLEVAQQAGLDLVLQPWGDYEARLAFEFVLKELRDRGFRVVLLLDCFELTIILSSLFLLNGE